MNYSLNCFCTFDNNSYLQSASEGWEGTVLTDLCLFTGGTPYIYPSHNTSTGPMSFLGGTPVTGGVPLIQDWMRYPYPGLDGVPLSRTGWDTPVLDWMEYPCPGLDGVQPLTRTEWGTHPCQDSIAFTCYMAGGMPFAFTQEDCLVELFIAKNTINKNKFQILDISTFFIILIFIKVPQSYCKDHMAYTTLKINSLKNK